MTRRPTGASAGDRGRARAGRRPGHQPAQRPLPDRLHRLQRRAAGAHRRRRPVRHRRPLHHAGRHPGARRRAAGRPGHGPALARAAVRRGTGRLGYESHDVTVDGCARWRRCWPTPAAGAGARVASGAPSRRSGRSRTTTRSRRCAGPARSPTGRWPSSPPRARCGPGAPSCEVGRELDARMLDAGRRGAVASRRSSPPAPNSAIPHHRPDATVLRDGDFLKLDFGATVDGYHSDMTRTVVLGHAGRLAARDLRAGRGRRRRPAGRRWRSAPTSSPSTRRARDVIADAGHGDHFTARPRARRGPGDPRGAGHRAARRGYPGRRHGRHRGAGRLPARPRRCPDRGHRWSSPDDAPELLTLTSKELLVL